MSGSNSSTAATPGKPTKPAKPNPEFPLFPHATRRWAKKIRGRMHYFGPWDDPDGALDRYLAQKDALHAGRKPRDTSAGVTIKEACNKFLAAKLEMVKSGELKNRTWLDYKAACELILKHFGKGRLVADLDPDDFGRLRAKMAQRWGLVTLQNMIQRIRVVFKFAADNQLIDRPVCFGQNFKRPSQKNLRRLRAKKGQKLFSAAEIRELVNGALVPGANGPELVRPSPALRAMVLLGINCGHGNADCGQLPMSAVDLDSGFIDFPRPKTGIERRCPLWPETVEAIREALASRPEPKLAEHAELVFLTKYGGTWARDSSDQVLAKEFAKLCHALRINRRRKGLGFYTLRHVFRTVADETKDQPAVDWIMGHLIPGMSGAYREMIADRRLRAVTDYVRAWLFGDKMEEREGRES